MISGKSTVHRYRPQFQSSIRKKPEINTYYRLTAAGLYIFPWLEREDTDSMEAYLKKDNGHWMNLIEEGFALCSGDGLYVSNQSMVVGKYVFVDGSLWRWTETDRYSALSVSKRWQS